MGAACWDKRIFVLLEHVFCSTVLPTKAAKIKIMIIKNKMDWLCLCYCIKTIWLDFQNHNALIVMVTPLQFF